MTRSYAALPYEYLEEMEALTDEEFGRLCRGLLRYSREGEPIRSEGNLRFFTRRVMGREDRFQESYEAQRQKLSRAGKKAAAARWGKGATGEDSEPVPSDGAGMPSHAGDDNTKAEAKAETKPKPNPKAEAEADTGAGPLPATAGERDDPSASASAQQRADRPTREEVFDYLREKGLRVDGERFWAYYQARDWLTKKGRPVDWRDRARHWAETEGSFGGQVIPLRTTDARRRAENESSIAEMRRALELMKSGG